MKILIGCLMVTSMDKGPLQCLPLLLRDERVTVYHLAVYVALCDLWRVQGNEKNIFISRRIVMRLAKINALPTYHKHLQQLQEMNYISYFPSYHPRRRSVVIFNIK